MKIPRPFSIAIDDLGWMKGSNEGWHGKGPHRLGIKRLMSLSDYEAITSLAQKVGVRLQGLFILGELDREGIAARTPTVLCPTLPAKEIDPESQLSIMDFVKSNAAYLEFGLHGVGHEYWPSDSGYFKRAEWYNLIDKEPWPEESIRAHLDCFVKIMNQYGLNPNIDNSFPESFVPCAYSYYWNPKVEDGGYSLGNILSDYGVKYANTDFTQIPESNPPIDGGFDNGVHVLNRLNFGNLWYQIGATPTIPVKYQQTDFIEVHWPNLLAQDDFLQEMVTDEWVRVYQQAKKSEEKYCSKNTAQHHSQFLYCKYTTLTLESDTQISIDNTAMPVSYEIDNILGILVLKIPVEQGKHLTSITLDGKAIPAYFEEYGFSYLFLPKLSRKKYALQFTIGDSLPKDIVWHDSTCNILNVESNPREFRIRARLYGNQTINFLTEKQVESVTTQAKNVSIAAVEKHATGINIHCTTNQLQGTTVLFSLKHL